MASNKTDVKLEAPVSLAPGLRPIAQLVKIATKSIPEIAACIGPKATEIPMCWWLVPTPTVYQTAAGTIELISRPEHWRYHFVDNFPSAIYALLFHAPRQSHGTNGETPAIADPALDDWQQTCALLRIKQSLGMISGADFVREVCRNPALENALLRFYPTRAANHAMITNPELRDIGGPTVPTSKQISTIRQEMGVSKQMSDEGRWNINAARIGAPNYEKMIKFLTEAGPKAVDRFHKVIAEKYDAKKLWDLIKPWLQEACILPTDE